MDSSQDKNWRQRLQDVLALGNLEDHQQLIASLLASLKRDPHPRVRQAAVEMLFTHDKNAVETLVKEYLGQSFLLADDILCDDARAAMERIGSVLLSLGEQAVEPLIGALEKWDDDWSVTEEIAIMLGRIGDVRGIAPLNALMTRHWSLAVREAASGALKRIATRRELRDVPILKNPPNFVKISDAISRLDNEEVPCGKDSYIEFEAVESHRIVRVVKSLPDDDWSVYFHVYSKEELSHAVNLFNSFPPEEIKNPRKLFRQLEQAQSQGKNTSVLFVQTFCHLMPKGQ